MPEEYDYSVEFTRHDVRRSAFIGGATHAGKRFKWVVGWGPKAEWIGFDTIGGKYVQNLSEARHPELALVNDRRYVTKVEVRRDRLVGYLDGHKVTEFRTDYSNLSTFAAAKPRDSAAVGLVVSNGSATFHRAELTEVTGRGLPTRAAAAPTSGKVSTINDPAFQAWVKATQALPAEKQVEAVSKKLMELNPGFDGKAQAAASSSRRGHKYRVLHGPRDRYFARSCLDRISGLIHLPRQLSR